MSPLDLGLIALADQIRSHLEHGAFAGRKPVELAGGEHFADAELAARILLADVEHCRDLEQASPGGVRSGRCAALLEDLQRLQGLLAR